MKVTGRNRPAHVKAGRRTSAVQRFTAVLERSTNRLWGAHFRIPAPVAKKLQRDGHRRIVCELNGVAQYQCAMLPFGRGMVVVSVNKSLRDKLGLQLGSKLNVVLRKDVSKYGLPVPDEFHAVLAQDKEGTNLFHSLTRGRQRTLLYIIGQVKVPDKRIFRSITIIDHLKANKGKIDYKRLSAELKTRQRLVL